MILRKAVISMKFKSIGYCIGQGFKNIGRNRVFSLASVATMSLCILILGLFYSVTTNVTYMVNQLSETLCVKVFFEKDVSETRIQSIGNSIKNYSGVTTVHYTSSDEAWEIYKQIYFGDDYQDLADGFEADNPLANSSSYEVYFKNADMQQALVKFIESIDGVRKVDSSEVTADSLTEINSLVGKFSLVILAVLLAVTLFLINNTISIGIRVREQEISIMRLLGARNGFIRAPFVVEGTILGLLGSIIPLVVIYFVYGVTVDYIMSKFSFIANILEFQSVNEIFKLFAPVSIAIGLGLGLMGSIISLGRHLKV